MKKRRIGALLLSAVLLITALGGCGSFGGKQEAGNNRKDDNHLTVYLWDSSLMGEFASYVKEQCPDVDVEFISGNNNVFLYDYLEKHGELPDIITTRRFSAADAQNLCPYLLDFSAYDVVSDFYPYVLQFYQESDGGVHWLPVCGIPETMIINKTLFEKYGIAIPENYAEFADACAKLQENGIKPFVRDWEADYSNHSLLQGAALDQFTSLAGMSWRSQVDSANGEITFDKELWTNIFKEVSTFTKDTGLGPEDVGKNYESAYEEFVNGKAAINCGTPGNMATYQSAMADELIRLPYFSQTSNESWIYTYPSLNIAINNSVADDEDKMDDAMKVLNCFLSEKGQKIIAAGQGMISYNVDVPSDLSGMTGVEEEAKKNAFYIRYASNASFEASLEAVSGIMKGELNEQQAMEVFESTLTAPAEQEEVVANFENTYSLSLNEKGGRDAASSVLTTVRKAYGADLAFTNYYNYTASLHAGEHTKREISMMVKNGNVTVHLAMAELTGRDVKALVEAYLKDTGTNFRIKSKYELPIASGMKMILTDTGNGYELKDIEVDGTTIGDDTVYKILVSGELDSLFARVFLNQEASERLGVNLSQAWSALLTEEGKKPEQPEDYIKIEK